MASSKFTLQYVPQKAIKGQALADFLAQHPFLYRFRGEDVEIDMVHMQDNFWTTYFNRLSAITSASVGMIIQLPKWQRWLFTFKLDFDCTNNQAEYEALVISLGMVHNRKVTRVLVLGNLKVVINQIKGNFHYMSCTLALYHIVTTYFVDMFSGIICKHISQIHSNDANELT